MARAQPPNNTAYLDKLERILCPICHRSNLPRARFCQHCGRDIVLNNDGPTYRITRVIKEGGQGAVYEVIGEDGQTYAIKEMLERALDPKELDDALERFEFEANLLQRLKHPRIPCVYAHFKDEGRNYLAMDFVRGEDLEELLKREGRLTESRVLVIADQVCDVLAYLHDNGLIYRDMKPSNIMVEPDGSIKLVDFGIAKLFQKHGRATQIGTPGYAPPEQYQGIATSESDIYALGATLHHMLTGRDPRDEAPFSFPAVATLAPAVSRRTAEAVARSLQMQPEERFRSVADVRAALRPISVPTRQIRRAPSADAIPAPARQSGSVSAQAQSNQAQPAPPRPVIVPPPPAVASAPAQPAAAPRQNGFFAAIGRFIRSLVSTVVVLAVLSVGLLVAGWYFLPDFTQPLLSPYLPPIVTDLLPEPAGSAAPALSTQQFQSPVEVSLPASADDAAIKAALDTAYAEVVRTQFGESAQVNPNVPIAYLSPLEQVSSAGSDPVTYRATLSGWIFKSSI
ncbi:MAG: protein kinase [Roseiflexaceae bacterium]|nr:protein kinase [Roseiflexaceae bacterium]